jgi:hypothetical protein
MSMHFKSKQRGLSFIGLLFVGGLIAAAGVVVAQAIPTFIEYQSVVSAVNKAKYGSTIADIRSSFDKSASIDRISSITSKDLEVVLDGDKTVVSFAYQREIHLAGPAFLTLKYAGRSK